MITRDSLKDLAGARSADGLFLSAFLSTSRLDDWRQTAPTFLNSEFNRLIKERGLDKNGKRHVQDNLQRILDVVQYDVTSKTEGLSVFADGGSGLFQRIELPLRLSNRLVLGPSPYVRPLIHALSRLEPFIVVRVSRDESTIYVVDELHLASETDITGPYLKSTDRETGDVPVKEYYAAARQETLVELHYRDVAQALDRLLRKPGVRRVILSAQHEIAAHFRKSLSPRAAKRVVAEIAWDPAVTVAQLLVTAREARDGARQAEMERLAARIAEGLGAHGRGVAGFDETMGALHRGQVRTLLVDGENRPSGWRCVECDFAVLIPGETCPMCRGGMVPVDDAVGEAIRVAILQGTFVEVAENVEVLESLGGIGGLLRYA
ncbi:MAG: hypothetical protein M5U22_12100 [Thermoleophilia bacterium]|nr:hypothetical protein [Thermoleophilia bacterium]